MVSQGEAVSEALLWLKLRQALPQCYVVTTFFGFTTTCSGSWVSGDSWTREVKGARAGGERCSRTVVDTGLRGMLALRSLVTHLGGRWRHHGPIRPWLGGLWRGAMLEARAPRRRGSKVVGRASWVARPPRRPHARKALLGRAPGEGEGRTPRARGHAWVARWTLVVRGPVNWAVWGAMGALVTHHRGGDHRLWRRRRWSRDWRSTTPGAPAPAAGACEIWAFPYIPSY